MATMGKSNRGIVHSVQSAMFCYKQESGGSGLVVGKSPACKNVREEDIIEIHNQDMTGEDSVD
jgi:hypothetical protein